MGGLDPEKEVISKLSLIFLFVIENYVKALEKIIFK